MPSQKSHASLTGPLQELLPKDLLQSGNRSISRRGANKGDNRQGRRGA